jgi:hypothetical protein
LAIAEHLNARQLDGGTLSDLQEKSRLTKKMGVKKMTSGCLFFGKKIRGKKIFLPTHLLASSQWIGGVVSPHFSRPPRST